MELGYVKSAAGEARESVAFNVQPRHTGKSSSGRRDSMKTIGRNRNGDPWPDAPPGVRLFAWTGPSLRSVRTWTGFRPSTADKLPLIGPWPETPGLYLAAGHEGLGITNRWLPGNCWPT